ncbi:S-layer homology domain-containing protein [Paenisporosarcina sp.]|uniref:S-layer homology domain-containing protein n=1 Tax=Paenisporosarcina sp. TaxID=1932001 RepID=UPI003C73DE1A
MKKIYVLLFSFILILTANVGQANAEGFTDVQTKHKFYKQMMYLYNEGIISGYEDGRFGPNDTVTRGQAAMMIAKALDLDTTPRDSTFFKDIKITNRFSGAIESAAKEKIIQGNTDGSFDSDSAVKRGDMAMFIARAFKMTDEELISFSDVSIDKRSYSAVRKIIAAGVAEGYDKNNFGTEDSIKRSDFSAFLARVLNPEEFKLPVNSCGYDAATKTNPDRQTVNCLLTKEAIKQGVPPEIVKAIASQENGPWKQFNDDGTAIETPDGGIGLMQITETTGYTVEDLKSDLTYNIYAGVEMLNTNFINKNLPTIGEMKREELQSWYFAVMAYNGIKPKNSPLYQDSGLTNTKAYQEGVYSLLYSAYELSNVNLSPKGMRTSDFQYDKNSAANIQFKKMHYEVAAADRTLSKEMFEAGDDVDYLGIGLRSKPSANNSYSPVLTTITSNDDITILGGLVYDESNESNIFAWYPVKVMKNDKPFYGYIASKYIK